MSKKRKKVQKQKKQRKAEYLTSHGTSKYALKRKQQRSGKFSDHSPFCNIE